MPVSLRIQSVLFHSDADRVTRSLLHTQRAIEVARKKGVVGRAEIALGDGSASPVFAPQATEALRASLGEDISLRYDVFGQNLGTARGHNRLFESAEAEYVVVMNPDVLMTPQCLVEMFAPFRQDSTGIVEARQMPIEHPKEYKPATGETSWASTACCLIPSNLWRKLKGFDADTFFLYCDDVDFSWRVRLAGKKVIFQPSAIVFHDKRLGRKAEWQSTAAERYFSAEAALLLAHKYSRSDVLANIIRDFQSNPAEHLQKALNTFMQRKKEGKLCTPIDPRHQVGQFIQGEYAIHRFRL